jgi:hypothetical protein
MEMKRSLLFVVAVIFLMSLGLIRAEAKGRYGQWELTPSAAYGSGLGDFSRLNNNYSYSLWISYWMNDTSTFDINFSYLQSQYDVDIHEQGESTSKERPNWNMLSGTMGFRYQPQLDFFLDTGLGAGLGYEFWNTKGTEIDDRKGNSVIYYLLADVEYPVRPWFSVGAYVQPLYLPLAEHLEKNVAIVSGDDNDIEYDKLKNSFIINTGIWFSFRIY